MPWWTERGMAALERIDDVAGAEADAEVCGGQVHLGLAVGDERDRCCIPPYA